jgi:hypothetical protein
MPKKKRPEPLIDCHRFFLAKECFDYLNGEFDADIEDDGDSKR